MLTTTSEEKIETKMTKAATEERSRMEVWLKDRIAAAKKKPSSEVVTMTPCLAGLLLERNPVNRPISRRNADDLAGDIANGRWQFNGESVVVSDTGLLIDGQHRALQVIATGRSIETVIVFGPKEKARFTIDIGRSKTVSNFLAMQGRSYTHALGAAVNYYVQWKTHGRILYGGAQMPTKSEVLATADELTGMDTSVDFTAASMKTIRSHAVLAFCHYVFWKKAGRTAADEFILSLIDGDNLRKGNPMLYCRNRLASMGRLIPAGARVELVFKCWNAHRLGAGVDAHFRLSGKLPKVES